MSIIKFVAGLLLVVGLFVATYLVVEGISRSQIRKAGEQIENLTAQIEVLRKSFAVKESEWQKREKELLSRAKYLSTRISKLEKERVVLESTINGLRDKRQSIVVPDSVDDIAAEFRRSGIKSAVASPRPR